MLVERGYDPQAHVRGWADGQGNTPPGQLGDERGVFHGTHAVLDPLGLERLQRAADGRRPRALPGVRSGVEAAAPRLGEDLRKGRRRIAVLRPGQSHRHHL
ncbi:MAG: hypothetical protein A2148_05920 [Chloroflexi bacterium RBG_16_68_14]|nr:MAG: hypothetical protein A2148_05920 [Chloroflexi bacterium RBG_16_68_14]